jgi:ADP-heptose:LPS heptosyltransferase
MLDKLRKKIGRKFLNYRYRKVTDKIIDFHQSFLSARKFLICLPSEPNELQHAGSFLSLLKEKFSDREITLITTNIGKSLFGNEPYKFITISTEQIGFFFLPKKDFIQKIKNLDIDVAIDLNEQFNLLSACICRESKATLRVSFFKDRCEQFFNFQIRPKPSINQREKFNALIKYIHIELEV